MFITPERTVQREVEETWEPRSTYSEYIGSVSMLQFMDNPLYQSSIEGEIRERELEEYRNTTVDANNAWGLGQNVIEQYAGRRENVEIPTMTYAQFQHHPDRQKGMKYYEDMSIARFEVLARQNKKTRLLEKTRDLRGAGVLETASSWLAIAAVEGFNPLNYVSVGAPGGTVLKAAAVGAAENVGVELLSQFVTSRQRAEAGISLTVEERMTNVAFAAVLGAAFGGGSKAWRNKKEKINAVEKEKAKKAVAVVEEHKKSILGMVDNTLQFLDMPTREKIMARLGQGFDEVGIPRIREFMEPLLEELPDNVIPNAQKRILTKVFGGDPEAARALLKASNAEITEETINSLIPESITKLHSKEASVKQRAQKVVEATEENKLDVADDQDVSIENITPKNQNESLLSGKTLFEVADNISNNVGKGIDFAAEFFSKNSCL